MSSHGHLLPTLALARLLGCKGVKYGGFHVDVICVSPATNDIEEAFVFLR